MATAVAIKAAKPKITVSAVQGKIIVVAEDGERIGQWGGTECFLSRQSSIGPCFVARSGRHKKHEGTFFDLARLKRVLPMHVSQGKLTLVVEHGQRTCTIFIETTTDVDELRMMAGILQDRARWKDMERNVARKSGKGDPSRKIEVVGSNAATTHGDGGGSNRRPLRDPLQVPLRGQSLENEVGEMSDNSDRRSSSPEQWSSSSPASPFSQDASTALQSSPVLESTAGMQWTAEQQRATQLLRAGRSVFVTGAAGTGKTVWLSHVLANILPPVKSGRTAVTAATGIAARLLQGCTVHSFAGIGRGEGSFEAILQRVQSRSDVVRAWRSCEVLVIDEISMLSSDVFTLLDRIARVVRASGAAVGPAVKKSASVPLDSLPFGGLQLLLVGDFLQLPPISRGAGEEVQSTFASPTWAACRFVNIHFDFDYRHAVPSASGGGKGGSDSFTRCCADVRRGCCSSTVMEVLAGCVRRPLEERWGVEATTIMARRRDVDRFNQQRLQQLDGAAFQRYVSEDYAATPGTDIDAEVSLPPVLTLKEGAQVVLLAALPEEPHRTNGELGVVVGFAAQAHGPALPVVRFLDGGESAVPRVTMEVYGREGRLSLSRVQVPLQLAWALTVHRVQGMTLPMARVSLDASFFEEGQPYVAISRVRRAEDLSLMTFDPKVVSLISPAALAFYQQTFPSIYTAKSQDSDAATRKGSETVVRRRPYSPVDTASVGASGPAGVAATSSDDAVEIAPAQKAKLE